MDKIFSPAERVTLFMYIISQGMPPGCDSHPDIYARIAGITFDEAQAHFKLAMHSGYIQPVMEN